MLVALLLAHAAPEKHLSVFSTAANYSVTLVQRDNRDYVGLLELLEPLGTVSARSDGPRWRVRYNKVAADFQAGNNRARIQGRDIDLSGKFLLENGRGLVPLASLNTLLPHILGGPVTMHETSARLFVGNVATHFTASLAGDNPPRLVFNFSSPVSPSVATEPGTLRMTFTREPVVAPASPTLTFGSKINSVRHLQRGQRRRGDHREHCRSRDCQLLQRRTHRHHFSDLRQRTNHHAAPGSTGNAAAAVRSQHSCFRRPAARASPPLLRRRRCRARRRRQRRSSQQHAHGKRHHCRSRPQPASGTRKPWHLHSGAARFRHQPHARPARLFANASHAAIYIALHAASSGRGVRIYTALLPYGGEDRGPFAVLDNRAAPVTAPEPNRSHSPLPQNCNDGKSPSTI